jgi:hypothetical protein
MNRSMLLSLMVLLTGYCFSQPANTNLSNTFAFAGEPYLAINPLNPQNIVVAWMAVDLSTGPKTAIKTRVSFDGGNTWSPALIHPHIATTTTSADVSMQFRRNGTLYINYIESRQSPDSGGVFISHSLDGGLTWSALTKSFDVTDDVAKDPLDRPWLATDNSQTANDGMFYVTTKPAPWIPEPNRPYLKSSTDSGVTWSPYRYVDTTNYLVGNLIQAPMAFPATTADGALCAAYPSYLFSQSPYAKILFAKSYTRGSHFNYYDLLVNFPAVADTNYKLGYILAANPANASQLAFAFIGNLNGDPDVFVASTNNGGTTWSTPVRVNDDAVGNGIGQDLVWISYAANGDMLVAWRDRRNGAGTGYFQACDTYCAVSRNNGTSFLPNIRLSSATAAFDSVLIKNGNDFMSCALASDTIYAAWSDVRNTRLNIYFAKTVVDCALNKWTGAVSTAWENPGNWSCARIPDRNTDVEIPAASTVVVSSAAFCRSLLLDPTVSFTVTPTYSITVVH